MIINTIDAIEALDSRGTPTVLCILKAQHGVFTAAVPSGASVGAHEALELRDGGMRYGGKGVKNAVEHVRTIINEKLQAQEIASQWELDTLLLSCDQSEDKHRLGANAILCVSLAGARALAAEAKRPLYRTLGHNLMLPCPMMNILNGGAHADNNLEIQEFMIMPVGAQSFSMAVEICADVYRCLKELLKKDGLSTAVGDEGGFAPNLSCDEQALEYILAAANTAGAERLLCLALDAAASGWAQNEAYQQPKTKRAFSRDALIAYYRHLVEAYPIASIEDGMGEEDFAGFAMMRNMGIQIVGDDLFVTNAARIERGIEQGAANAVLIKPNQIGTLSETLRAMQLAAANGYAAIVSHRSGDTEDAFIADLAVGTGCGQIKTGAPCRAERTAKYNRLLFIEKELGPDAIFAGKSTINAVKNI